MATYYRYEIRLKSELVGGLFRGIEFVLADIDENADIQKAIADYESLNYTVGLMETMLVKPDLYDYEDVTFYYTELGRQSIQEHLGTVREILEDWGYRLVETTVDNPSNIVYCDEYQIAVA